MAIKNTKLNNPANHSEEVNEIIGHVPGKLLRYGTVGFLLVIILILIASWIIEYPEVVKGSCTLHSLEAPRNVVSRINGRLSSLLVSEGQSVKENQLLAVMQSAASYNEIEQLSQVVHELWKNIKQNNREKMNISPENYKQLGEVQRAFQAFYNAYIQMNSFIIKEFYLRKKDFLVRELQNTDSLKNILLNQKRILQTDYLIAENEFQAKNQLYTEKVIARLELKEEESKLLSKMVPLENIEAGIMNNNSTYNAKKQEIHELDKQYYEIYSAFLQSLNDLTSNIEQWKLQYLLTSPIKGIVAFNGVVQPNQELSSGKDIFFIESAADDYYAEVLVNQDNFGKVNLGQPVIIRLPSYPVQEFGHLQGKVISVSRFPNDEKQYIIKVSLSHGLLTNTRYRIRYTNRLTGDADIVTNKKKLLNKLLFGLKRLFDRDTW